MKITRYPQSCLLIEHKGRTLVIDPGDDFLEKYKKEDLRHVEAVLYTHQHSDHFVPEVAQYLADMGALVVCNMATAKLIDNIDMWIVDDGDTFTAAGMSIVARELLHCPLPDGSDGPQNTGYVVEDIFFHPGDGKELDGLKVDNLALPITGPDISVKDAFDFARQLEAKVVIPIHYDKLGAKPDMYKKYAEKAKMPFEVRVLADGESTKL